MLCGEVTHKLDFPQNIDRTNFLMIYRDLIQRKIFDNKKPPLLHCFISLKVETRGLIIFGQNSNYEASSLENKSLLEIFFKGFRLT